MKYLIIYLFLLNSAYFYAIVFKKTIEETLLPSFITKILLLYISGLFETFILGFWIIVIKNIIYMIYNVHQTIKKKENIKKVISVGNLIFTFLFVFFIWISDGRMISIWDEFTHWGLVVKNMFYLDNLAIGGNSSVVATSYLSGTSIFQYFLMKIYGSFNEGLMYFGQNILMVSALLPIFKNYEHKSLKSTNVYLLLFIMLFLPSMSFDEYFTSIYVDCMLGFAFTSLVYNYYTLENDLFKKIVLGLNFIFLIFVKDFGIALALLCFAIILIDQLFIRNKFEFKIKKIWDNIKYPLIYIILSAVIKVSWSIYVSNHVEAIARSSGLLDTVLKIPTYLKTDCWQHTVIVNFFKELFEGSLISFFTEISCVGVVIFFVLINSFVYKKDKTKSIEEKRSHKWLTFALTGGTICYAFALLCCYLGIFGEYEAVRLASFNRYMNSYTLPLILLSALFLFEKYRNKECLHHILLGYVLVIVTSIYPPVIYNLTINNIENKTNTVAVRNEYLEAEKTIRKNVNIDERVYLIATCSKGLEFWTLRYVISPIPTNLEEIGWSIGEPYYEGDVWTRRIEPDAWIKNLTENYEYVYLYKVEEQFETKYGKLFDHQIESNQLYKVDKKNAKLVFVE